MTQGVFYACAYTMRIYIYIFIYLFIYLYSHVSLNDGDTFWKMHR